MLRRTPGLRWRYATPWYGNQTRCTVEVAGRKYHIRHTPDGRFLALLHQDPAIPAPAEPLPRHYQSFPALVRALQRHRARELADRNRPAPRRRPARTEPNPE